VNISSVIGETGNIGPFNLNSKDGARPQSDGGLFRDCILEWQMVAVCSA